MASHYFHLTNGEDFVIDGKGAAVRTKSDVLRRAQAAAAELMKGLPLYGRWSEWLVCVHDAAGRQVAVVPFLGGEELPAETARTRLPHRAQRQDAPGAGLHACA